MSAVALERARAAPPGAGADPIHLFCCDEDIAMCGAGLKGEEKQERDDDTPVCPLCALVEDEGLPCPVPGCPGDDGGIETGNPA
jgi:hypothetical protein